MAKDKKRRSEGRLRVVSPEGAEAFIAWASLVRALVETMQDAEVETSVIVAFLANLDEANVMVLEGSTLDFALFVTNICRETLPSND